MFKVNFNASIGCANRLPSRSEERKSDHVLLAAVEYGSSPSTRLDVDRRVQSAFQIIPSRRVLRGFQTVQERALSQTFSFEYPSRASASWVLIRSESLKVRLR